jgi:hypothetical protein
MEEQKKLAELLWAANDLKEKYKKAITATDEMLKAKFREMFGDTAGNSKNWPMPKFGDSLNGIENGKSFVTSNATRALSASKNTTSVTVDFVDPTLTIEQDCDVWGTAKTQIAIPCDLKAITPGDYFENKPPAALYVVGTAFTAYTTYAQKFL